MPEWKLHKKNIPYISKYNTSTIYSLYILLEKVASCIQCIRKKIIYVAVFAVSQQELFMQQTVLSTDTYLDQN
jgi:hypothetical protein